jgi:hypothetical protein
MNPIRTRTVAGSTFFLATFATLATFGACTSFGSSTNPEEDAGAIPSPEAALPDAGVLPPGPVPFDAAVPFTLKVPTEPVVAVRGRTAGTFDVTVEPALKGDVVLEGLPPGVTAKSVAFTVQGVAKMTVEVPAGIRSGTFEVTVKAKQLGTPSTTTAKVKLEVRGAPGEVDETFANYLKPIAGIPARSFTGVSDLLPLPDGSLLVAEGEVVRKLRIDGTPDTAFGVQGIARVAGQAATLLLRNGASIFALFSEPLLAGGGQHVFALDPATGTLTPKFDIPGTDVSLAREWTVLAAPSTLLVLGGQGSNWTALAFDPATSAATTWGTGGKNVGSPPPAFAFFTGTQDHLFAREPSGVRHVVFNKAGGIVRAASVGFGTPFSVAGVLKRGEDEFVFAQGIPGALQLLSVKADVVTPLGPTYAGSFGSGIGIRVFNELPDGSLAVGSTGDGTGILLLRTNQLGQPSPAFSSTGEVVVGPFAAGTTDYLQIPQRAVLAADKLRVVVASGIVSSGVPQGSAFALTRVWL